MLILHFFCSFDPRPEGARFKEIVRILQSVSAELREIDEVLTVENLIVVGLIEGDQSIELVGVRRVVPMRQVRRKASILPPVGGVQSGFGL